MTQLGLTWVLVDGRPRAVSEFAGVPPRRRPAATCPACGHRLTLKLGRVRRHHAAHAPDALCATTRPETALHFDVKLALAARLAAAAGRDAALRLALRCMPRAGGPCAAARDVPWVAGWDEVTIETRVRSPEEARRPDIVLRRAGRAIGAIEVLVTNRVSDEKAAALARLDVPWVEIRASAQLTDREPGWHADIPLEAERIGPAEAPDGWRCEVHVVRETVLRAARVADVYRAHGMRDRVIYRIDELRIERTTRALILRRDGREIASIPWDGSPLTRHEASGTLHAAYVADVQALTQAPDAFTDSPMRWATGDAADSLVHEALLDMRPGDPLPLATRYPRRWYFARERGAWFLPPDMREVTWDRPAPDVFAAHPAAARSRAIVRERPAPVESWGSFVFASRPSVASIGVDAELTHDGAVAILAPDTGSTAGERRALAILVSAASEEEVRRVDRRLRDGGVATLWLSHPLDWSSSRADLAWAPAGRDGRGRTVVVIDGLGIYRADAFVRAFRRGEPRLAPRAVKRRMADRVAALRSRTTDG